MSACQEPVLRKRGLLNEAQQAQKGFPKQLPAGDCTWVKGSWVPNDVWDVERQSFQSEVVTCSLHASKLKCIPARLFFCPSTIQLYDMAIPGIPLTNMFDLGFAPLATPQMLIAGRTRRERLESEHPQQDPQEGT